MACPYFFPSEPLNARLWVIAPRMPLGEAYDGTCRAETDEVFQPSREVVRELCNCGYARGRCERFPVGAAGDAVRLSLMDEADGKLRMTWIIEAEHVPVEHGTIVYDLREGSMEGSQDAVMSAQVRALVATYLRRVQAR